MAGRGHERSENTCRLRLTSFGSATSRRIERIHEYAAGESALAESWPRTLCCGTSPSLGEAVKGLSQPVRDLVPDADWAEAAQMRDAVIHRYFANDPSIIQETIERDLPGLERAVDTLLERIAGS